MKLKVQPKTLLVVLSIMVLIGCEQKPADTTLNLNQALGGIPAQGFARATAARTFQFPQDHAAHPQFRNEWWYITGNLQADTGQTFGYQVTFFRIALAPHAPDSSSEWATQQIWMAHVALTAVNDQQHVFEQRFVREAAGLAGQSLQPFRVWAEDWQILGRADGDFPWTLQIQTNDFQLALNLSPETPAVLQGQQGLSQKSSEIGNASYYYSFPRLQTQGQLTYSGQRFNVKGLSWLDREWSTSALGTDQVGWDWFSLQLYDGHSLMFYRLRTTAGQSDPHSAGKWIDVDGQTQNLTLNHVQLTPLRYWQQYPVAWTMTLPEHAKQWRIEAVVDDQLMQTSIPYWEGAVRVVDAKNGAKIGQGYLEMSGY